MFRYKILSSKNIVGETKLNDLGRQGYELTGVVLDADKNYIYYFKKEVNNG